MLFNPIKLITNLIFAFIFLSNFIFSLQRKSFFSRETLSSRHKNGKVIFVEGDSQGIIVKTENNTIIKKVLAKRVSVKVLKNLPKSKHIMNVIEIYEENDYVFYEVPYYQYSFMEAVKNMSVLKKKEVFIKILLTVIFLLERDIFCHDLDTCNILFDEKKEPILIDLDSEGNLNSVTDRVLYKMGIQIYLKKLLKHMGLSTLDECKNILDIIEGSLDYVNKINKSLNNKVENFVVLNRVQKTCKEILFDLFLKNVFKNIDVKDFISLVSDRKNSSSDFYQKILKYS